MISRSRVVRARVGLFAGLLMVAAGVYLTFGAGWALIVGGVALSAMFLIAYDVDDPPEQEVSR